MIYYILCRTLVKPGVVTSQYMNVEKFSSEIIFYLISNIAALNSISVPLRMQTQKHSNFGYLHFLQEFFIVRIR